MTREDFMKHLRDALSHLHDAEHLRSSPLATLFGVADRLDTSLALRRILTGAIESLKPIASAHSSARSWQLYESLYCYYVQQLSQQVVADQLAVSVRQLRREQHMALGVLADRLCEQFDLGSLSEQAAPSGPPTPPVERAALGEDLVWLKEIPPDKSTDYDEALSAVLSLVQPLASQHQVRLDVHTATGLPQVAAHPVAVNQILLSLLAAAIPQASGLSVSINAGAVAWGVQIDVRAERASAGPRIPSQDELAGLDVARQLTEMCAGKMIIAATDDASLGVTVTLPALECLPILVIDDNVDALHLMQRYAMGTRYRLITTRDPEEALALAESAQPQVIVLDVMMPQVDGWKVLGRLRQHPRTGQIPIVVCTILPHEALALSLGANAFIRKPMTRRDFLAALDRQVSSAARGPG